MTLCVGVDGDDVGKVTDAAACSAAAAAAAECDVTRGRTETTCAGSPAVDRLSGCPVADQLS